MINEVSSNNDEDVAGPWEDYPDWIEIHNWGNLPVNLEDYSLSDDIDDEDLKRLPDTDVMPGAYVVVWARGDDAEESLPPQVTFKLSAQGEGLYLRHWSGGLVDAVDIPALDGDLTYGRRSDQPDIWTYFEQSTPGAINDVPEFILPNDPPLVSQEAGAFNAPFFLTLTPGAPDAELRYTLDGSEPTLDSPLYTEPLWIDSRVGEENTISMVPTNDPKNEGDWFKWRAPRGEILKVVTLKVRAFGAGLAPSRVVTRTYLSQEEIQGRYNLPILSLTVDPEQLFGYYDGIFVPGYLYDQAVEDGYDGIDSIHPANYHVHGRESERPAHLEFFTPEGELEFSHGIGVRVNGNTSRAYPAKSLRVYMRDDYGDDALEYRLFPEEDTEVFERFLIRNGSQQFHKTLMKDGLSHTLTKGIAQSRVDAMAYRPVVLFINGSFWGIHNLRERLDDHYLSLRYDVDRDDIVIGELNGGIYYGEDGDEKAYQGLATYINNEDLSDPQHYAHVQSQMDTDNYIDYMALQIFIQNTDWPNNNYRYWRKRLDAYDPEAGVLDGRWRWFLSDADATWSNPAADHLVRVMDPDLLPGYAAWAPAFFNGLLANPDFKRDFINRFADLLNSALSPEVIGGVVESIAAKLDTPMAEHSERWTYPKSKDFWEDAMDVVRVFGEERAGYQRTHIVENFNLMGTSTLTLGATPGGHLEVNSLTDLGDGWEGIYFHGIPISVRAVPEEGHRFIGWEGQDGDGAELVLLMRQDTEVRALFEAI